MNVTKIKKPAAYRVMKLKVNIQRATKKSGLPSNQRIRAWVRLALENHMRQAELNVRMVGASEGARLNHQWRGKNGPTNVLSFAVEKRNGLPPGFLGDIVLCAPVITREAMQQGKFPEAHWAHMIIHGALHLLGYDHIKPAAARKMENLEKKLLAALSIADPYK